jgi:uncharacterized protein YrzB (UPF0473 family)
MSEEYGSDFITLTDEDDGTEHVLEHLDTLDFEDKVYMAFTPAEADADAEETEIIILRAEDEEGEEMLVTIEDEAELDRVYSAFMERLEAADAEA